MSFSYTLQKKDNVRDIFIMINMQKKQLMLDKIANSGN